MYAQGSLQVNGNTGSATAPLNLTIAASNAVTFDGNAYIQPYAAYPNLCGTDSGNPVCTGQVPHPGLVGLCYCVWVHLGGDQGGGIVFNGNSDIYGSIASLGDIISHGGTTIYGRIVTDANLTMNREVGVMVNGAQNVNFWGHQQ